MKTAKLHNALLFRTIPCRRSQILSYCHKMYYYSQSSCLHFVLHTTSCHTIIPLGRQYQPLRYLKAYKYPPFIISAENQLGSCTVGAQSIAHAQSIAPRHSTYVIMPKKAKFRKFLFGKTKKKEFARRFFKKTVYFRV